MYRTNLQTFQEWEWSKGKGHPIFEFLLNETGHNFQSDQFMSYSVTWLTSVEETCFSYHSVGLSLGWFYEQYNRSF